MASAERVSWILYGIGVVFVEMEVALLKLAALSKHEADISAITSKNNKTTTTARLFIYAFLSRNLTGRTGKILITYE